MAKGIAQLGLPSRGRAAYAFCPIPDSRELPTLRPLRSHQRRIAGIVSAIVSGEAGGLRDVLAAVTPGGGKIVLPVIAAARLIEAGIADRVCWIVPRDILRLQAEEAFADPNWRAALGHALSVRAAENAPDPCRGLAGYVTTYQASRRRPTCTSPSSAATATCWWSTRSTTCRRSRTRTRAASARWARAGPTWRRPGPRPSCRCWSWRGCGCCSPARWSGRTGAASCGCPTGRGRASARGRSISTRRAGRWWAIRAPPRSRSGRCCPSPSARSTARRAGWTSGASAVGPHRLSAGFETTRPALFTALRTGFAEALLDEALGGDAAAAGGAPREARPGARRAGAGPRQAARGGAGPGAMPAAISRCVHDRMPARGAGDGGAARRLRRGATRRRRWPPSGCGPQPSVLVTVAMAYEGLDAPETAVVAALTHIRSRPWLEQMVARATRVDPYAGAWEEQRALVYHPDDLLFRRFRERMETEQGTLARHTKGRRQPRLPFPGEAGRARRNPASCRSRPTRSALRFETLGARPRLRGAAAAARRARRRPTSSIRPRCASGGCGTASARWWRRRWWRTRRRCACRARRGRRQLPRLNAVLKRVLGKGRGEMGAAELEAAVAWLERNRLADHLHLLEGDGRYAFEARRRAGQWRPPQGPGRGARADGGSGTAGGERRRSRRVAERGDGAAGGDGALPPYLLTR